jgi:outer membrane protein TolC
MLRATTTVHAVGITLLITLALAPTAALAQPPTATTATTAQPATTAPTGGQREPPVMRFDPQGIDLVQAVTITLQNAPDIQLADASALGALGFAQTQVGLFDTNLFGDSSYNYQRQMLSPNDFLGEVLKRQDLAAARDGEVANLARLNALRSQLTVMQNLSQECGTANVSAQLAALRRLDPETAAEMDILDALCASANQVDTSQQLRRDLLTIRQRLVTDTIDRVAQGVDESITAERRLALIVGRLGTAPDQEFFSNSTFNASLSRLFRNGISFSPFFNGTGSGTNFIGKPFNSDCEIGDCGGKGSFPLYTVKGGVNAFVPLARGLGAAATAAPERSALIQEQAARLNAQHQASLSALGTINAYWVLRAAQDNLDVAQRSVDLQGRVLDLTRRTIAAGNLPAIELARAQASEARSQTVLRDALVVLNQSRVGLALAMGVAVGSDDATLPRARDPFPPAPDATSVDDARLAALAVEGLGQRRDVMAALRSAEAAQVLVRGAQLNLKPRVDLNGDVHYTGLDEDVVTRAFKRWVGPSYRLGLNVEKPFGNNVQEGLLVEAQAGGQTSQISSADLRRQVRLDVVRTGRSLVEAIARVKLAQDSVQYYQQTIDGEIARFQIGEVTLIDTIQTEQQQTEARRALVAAQQEIAQLIAELRFETGTLVVDATSPVTSQALTTVPR